MKLVGAEAFVVPAVFVVLAAPAVLLEVPELPDVLGFPEPGI